MNNWLWYATKTLTGQFLGCFASNTLHMHYKQRTGKPLSKSAAGIETRDISGGFESAFVQVCDIPKGTSLDSLKPKLISEAIFGTTGKFGYVVIMNLDQIIDYDHLTNEYYYPL